MVIQINPFTGTGTYNGSDRLVGLTLALSTVQPGIWSCGDGLPFQHGDSSQPDKDVNMSLLTLSVQEN